MKCILLRCSSLSMLRASRQPPKKAVELAKACCSKETAHKRTRAPGALDVEGELLAYNYRESFGDLLSRLANDGGLTLPGSCFVTSVGS